MKSLGPESRRFRLRLRLGCAVTCLGLAVIAFAQTAPGTAVPGNPFEVHGLLYSGSAPAGSPLGDGWAQGAEFQGVLDDNGDPASDSLGAPYRASRQVDENWGNEGDGFDSTMFAGGNKNADLIGIGDKPWGWDVGGGAPQKNDITNAYFHTRVDPATGDRWVFVAAETRSIDGDSHVDFEFNQAGVVKTGTTSGDLIGLGPDGGRTVDDFLITIDFEKGGEHPVASIRSWNGSSFDLVSMPGAVFSATNLVDIPHGANGTWKHFSDEGAEVDILTRLQLVEGAANLTALGIGVDPCSTDATFMVKTRSSSSWTADLKDFAIVRFPLEPPPELEITAPELVCVGDMFEVSVVETTGLPYTTFEWALSGCGALLGDATSDVVSVQADPTCNCDIVVTVTITGGECHHIASARATVAVGDEVAPTLSGQPADVTVECDSITEPDVLSASDNCSEPEVQFEETVEPGVCIGSSTIVRTWTTADECDNVASHTQVMAVEDTTAPVLAGVPEDTAVACDSVPEPAEVTASDNCSETSVELAETVTPGVCEGDFAITRTWTATDACDNETAETQNVTVFDETAPVLSGVPADAVAECDALPSPPEVTAADNCSAPTVQLDEITQAGECVGESAVTRTWTATDDCRNEAARSQVISLVDTTAPVLVGVPANETVECDAIPDAPQVTATDNCSDPTVELIEETEPSPSAGKSMITRTWVATDDCGNQTTGIQIITVIDTTPPILSGVPDDVTVECDSVPQPPVVTATDNCADPVVAFDETVEPGACNGQLVITRTWTATDDCGNQTTQSQAITVVDTTAPTLENRPADETAECDSVPLPVDVTATDNCAAVTIDFSEVAAPGECPEESTITRTWTATDECGNQASHVQVISVVDTTAPVLSDDPADVTAECDSVPEAITVTAADNCDPDVPVTPGEQMTPGYCAGDYELLRTWSAADDCGNEASVDRIVDVSDTTAPVIRFGPTGTQYLCDEPVFFTASTTDNCVDAALTASDILAITADSLNRVIVTPVPAGTVTITVTGPAMIMGSFTATDGCGNVSDPFEFTALVKIGREACSQGFWRNHPEAWGPTGFAPDDLLLDAFQVTDVSSPEVPAGFDVNLTLITALGSTGGSLNQALLQGVAALLNAAHPDVDYPARVRDVRAAMQAAFSGEISFDEARAAFGVWNAAEAECGCPIE